MYLCLVSTFSLSQDCQKNPSVFINTRSGIISYFYDGTKIRTTTVRTNAYTACPHVAFETFIYKLQSLYNNYNLCIYNCMNIYFICTVSMLGGSKPCANRNSYNIIILISHLTVSTIH